MSDDSITQGNSISQIGIEFFTAVDDKPVQTAPLFTGYYPNKVAHTCQRFGVATSNQYGVKINLHSNRYWRERATGEQCDGCLYDKVLRMCKQVEAEVGIGKMMYTSTISNMRVIQRIQERQARTQEIGISKNQEIISIPSFTAGRRYNLRDT